ncbi:type 2 lanthipeptide synthetase LanM family protein [Pleurocapsa sp. PCC 7319]|uniref:type 2 lanthipeptide synthetase LanM family protein n=1 Tax=Pleurocapsa sp. PCC 7319 TaxID=118161 RepID=UPI00034DAF8D|nr:type 2 lanthipeptide synthetase LanM family protein [Pleurocapsa sp. PCC 7319]
MMKLATDPLVQLANNASSLSERINNNLSSQNNILTKSDQYLVEQQIINWCKLVGGKEKLEKSLYWYGLDLDSVCPLLKTSYLTKSSLPSWIKTFQALVQSSKNLSIELLEKKDLPIDSEHPFPFEDFYFPFILVARNKLNTQLASNYILQVFSHKAYQALERSLLKQLVDLGTETLLLEFNKVKETYYSQEQENLQTDESRACYTSFIQNIQQDGGVKFFDNYPVLARLITTTIDFWVESTAEFIQRLQNDLLAIKNTFSDNKSLGKVEFIDTSLSNPHHGKRFVLALTFSSGVKVVYKPKDLSLSVAFNQLFDWCNHQKISLPFKLTKILECQGYGWVEYIFQEPCLAQVEVNNFYKRAGMLLSLLYVLGAKNCHAENVIANGQYPVLIDADILMQPSTKNSDKPGEWFRDSVVGIGFLPAWDGDIDIKSSQDSSVLGNIHPHQVNSSREWKFINTDKMHLAPKSKIIPAGTNVVILDSKTIAPYDYQEDIVTGFEEIYRLLIEHKDTLIETETPLAKFKFSKSRFIVRPTLTYAITAKKSISPQYLNNGFDYSLLIDILNFNYSTTKNKSDTKEILTAEAKSLQRRDIPYFSVACDSNALEVEPNKLIQQFFKISSYQQLISRLKNLDRQDLALQLKMIRLSLYAKMAHRNKTNTTATQQDDYTQYAPLSSEQLIQEALKIGDSLVNSVIRHDDDCNWLSLEYMFKANRYQLQTLDNSLFTGRIGVCLFLAALAKVTGQSEYKDVALAALSPLLRSITKVEAQKRFVEPGLGIIGIGGIIYSLVKISHFLAEPELLRNAQELVKSITPEVIATDQKLDLVFGITGAIPGLLSLYQETEDRTVLDRAILCGNHLLSKQTGTFPRAWKTSEKAGSKPMTGLSHGASGIALSLLRLYAATSNSTYLEAAKEGVEYERNVFNKSLKRWPDFRLSAQANQLDIMYAWCNGSPGIGLARLGSLPIIKTKETYADIEIALDMTQKYELFNGTSSIDYLCCGSLGRTELFVLAAQRLNNQDWLTFARKNAAFVVARATKNKNYGLLPHLADSVLSPSFFKGSAGLGYQFLRLANPKSLPSVLIWE